MEPQWKSKCLASQDERDRIHTQELDGCNDEDVILVSFCSTLTEGVDTKRANMVVMVDPVADRTGLVRLFGRVQRKPMNASTKS